MTGPRFFDAIAMRARLIGGAILMGPLLLLAVLGLVLLKPEPIAQASVWGCYTAPNAPWLRVRAGRIDIGEPARRTFRFVAEPGKQGYRLAVEPALLPGALGNDRYAFRSTRGDGYVWLLLTATADRPRAMLRPRDFGGRFRITADDGSDLTYTRSADPNACREANLP